VGAGVGLAVAAVLFGLMWWQFLSKQRDQIRAQEQRLAELEAKIQEGRAAKQRLPQFREEVRRLELELDKLLRILPARLNTEDLLRRLRSLAEQGDLDLLRIRPGTLADQEFYSEWPIEIEMTGTYHNLALFFDRIGRFSRIINVDDLRIDALSDQRGHTLRTGFKAKTFVYRETVPPPEPAAGPPVAGGQPTGPPAGGGGFE
jgi:type IV pilus assembly protein PilO